MSNVRKSETLDIEFASFFQKSFLAMALLSPQWDILRVNPAFCKLLDYAEEDTTAFPFIHLLHPQETARAEELFGRMISGLAMKSVETVCLNSEGRPVPVLLSLCPASERKVGEDILVLTLEDLSFQKQVQNRLEYLTNYDCVTGLIKATMFRDRLEHAISRASREKTRLGLVMLSLRRFKKLNESFGRRAGNLILKEVAGRLGACLRESDTICRQRGDKFLLLLEKIEETPQIMVVLEKIFRELEMPFFFEELEFFLVPRVGIALYPEDGETADHLMENVETAMNRSRQEGRCKFQFYTRKMHSRARERLELEGSLHRALEWGEFVIHYQPQLELKSGVITAVEALLRWNHPERGLVAPNDFIPALEETGLITSVGEWTLQKACAQAALWGGDQDPPLRLAINISARQFLERDFLAIVKKALDDSGLPPHQLEMEITESILIKDIEESASILSGLSRMGIRISIDDFGTGYSSLVFLQRFPLQALKIDRSFIRGVPRHGESTAIACGILSLARNLGLEVTAEGVERQEQLRCLKDWGCQQIQGFLLAPPLSSEDFHQWMKNEWPQLKDRIFCPSSQRIFCGK